MSLFRPWVGSCEGDLQNGGPSMGLALFPNDHLLGGSMSSSSPSPTTMSSGCNPVINKSSSSKGSGSNGSTETKSFYSYYYQYYYSQLVYYASLQQQQPNYQPNGTLINKSTNCRSTSSSSSLPISAESTHREVTKSSTTNLRTIGNINADDNNHKHNINRFSSPTSNITSSSSTNSPESNERLNGTHLAHMNRSHTESRHSTLDSACNGTQHTVNNPSSGTNKRACEMGNQSNTAGGKTIITGGSSANLSGGKLSSRTESGTNHCSTVQPNGVAQTSRAPARTPSMSDIQNLLTFQNLFLDSFGCKKRASKSASDQRPKKFICSECKSGFSNRSQLNSHIRTHTGERPFVCDYKNCHKSFTRNEELTRHRRIHSGIRPYPCRWCDKRFGRKDHLRKHERTHERRLRSTILLNYTASLSNGQLFTHQNGHHHTPAHHHHAGLSSSSSSSNSPSSSSAELLAKVQASTLSLMHHEHPNHGNNRAHLAVTNSSGPISMDLSRPQSAQQLSSTSLAPKLLTAAKSSGATLALA